MHMLHILNATVNLLSSRSSIFVSNVLKHKADQAENVVLDTVIYKTTQHGII